MLHPTVIVNKTNEVFTIQCAILHDPDHTIYSHFTLSQWNHYCQWSMMIQMHLKQHPMANQTGQDPIWFSLIPGMAEAIKRVQLQILASREIESVY